MVRTEIFCKVTDSDATPFIEQKDVILCRSGIQLYHKSELQTFMAGDNKPPVDKEWYREYRPATVVVKAQDKCHSLPVTKEHPDDWVTPHNFSDLAGGTTDKEVSIVALDGESEGEIGIKSNITFYTAELYDYYLNNKEVSLGYTCKKHWVDNPEEVGYDIILDEITEVNHLAITRSGRGGSSVAVIDSIIGGLKPMRTGIFAWLAGKKQKDSAPSSFGKEVLEAVKNSKGTTEEEIASEMKCVLDSCAVLKDCEDKNTLINVVKDCFDNKEKAVANEAELVETLDSMYVNISGDSLKEIVNCCAKLKGGEAPKAVSVEDTTAKDSDKEDKEEETKDSEDKSDKEEETKDAEPKDEEAKDAESEEGKADEKKEEDKACDSALMAEKEALIESVKDSLKPMIKEVVTEILGIQKDSKPSVEGAELDSNYHKENECLTRDYSVFLEA